MVFLVTWLLVGVLYLLLFLLLGGQAIGILMDGDDEVCWRWWFVFIVGSSKITERDCVIIITISVLYINVQTAEKSSKRWKICQHRCCDRAAVIQVLRENWATDLSDTARGFRIICDSEMRACSCVGVEMQWSNYIRAIFKRYLNSK